MPVSLHQHPHSGKDPIALGCLYRCSVNDVAQRLPSLRRLRPAVPDRRSGTRHCRAIQRLNLVRRSAITIPQRRVTNDHRRVVVAVAQVGDEAE